MTTVVTDIDKGYKRIRLQLKQIKGSSVDIGYFAGVDHPSGSPMATIAAVHEFGAPRANIPQRSFMRTTVDRKKSEYLRRIESSKGEIMLGRSSVKRELNKLGETVAGDISKAIIDLRTPVLKPATSERKGSTNPLVDTGAMKGAVKHRVNIR